MPDTERYAIDVMSGRRRGPVAALLRTAMRCAEPAYRGVVNWRNRAFDQGKNIRRLNRPVVSVGNITTGGTGKTPVVAWLAGALQREHFQPAILMRGYRAEATGGSDEAQLYTESLHNIPVIVNPDRHAGGEQALRDHPAVNLFIMDDGFQHRRLHRDFDLVLISATNPFGFDHLLPRGLLREPLTALARANAILLTRTDAVSPTTLQQIESRIRGLTDIPIFRSIHTWGGLRSASAKLSDPPDVALDTLIDKKVLLLAGIADPQPMADAMARLGTGTVRTRWLGDHAAYDSKVVSDLAQSPVDLIVTTEKDWVKLRHVPGIEAITPRLRRLALEITFAADHGPALLNLIKSTVSD